LTEEQDLTKKCQRQIENLKHKVSELANTSSSSSSTAAAAAAMNASEASTKGGSGSSQEKTELETALKELEEARKEKQKIIADARAKETEVMIDWLIDCNCVFFFIVKYYYSGLFVCTFCANFSLSLSLSSLLYMLLSFRLFFEKYKRL
jgi:activator of HSP90 ATPase